MVPWHVGIALTTGMGVGIILPQTSFITGKIVGAIASLTDATVLTIATGLPNSTGKVIWSMV